MTTQIKITQLTDIGSANLAVNTLLPVVNMSGTPTTQKTTLGNLANVILSQSGSNYARVASANIAYSVANAAQPNITSVGTLTSLSVTGNVTSGNVTTAGLITVTGNIGGGNITTAGKVGAGTLSVTGTTNLGSVGNVTITGGTNGQVLTTNGSNVLSWTTVSGGGTTPGGVNTQIQFNDSGTFNGNTGFTFNKTTGLFTAPFLAGNGNGLSNIQGANVSGTVGNANLSQNLNVSDVNNNFSYHVVLSAGSGDKSLHIDADDNLQYNPADGTLTAVRVDAGFMLGNLIYSTGYLASNVVGLGNIATLNLTGSTSNVLYGNGVFAPVTTTYGNSNVVSLLSAFGSNTINTTGNITLGNAIFSDGSTLSGSVLATEVSANIFAGTSLPGLETDYTDSVVMLDDAFTQNSGEAGYPWGITLPVSYLTYDELIQLSPGTFPNQTAVTTIANNTQNTWELWQDTIAETNVTLTANELNWTFKNDGSMIFPTLTVDIHNGGNQTAQTLHFGDATQQAIITGPTPDADTNAERLIIQGQRASGTGEGGDVYLWAGDSDVAGGDIKIYAGDADSDTSGSGGYVNIDGGAGFDNGGDITLTGGVSANSDGGSVSLAGGQGQVDGGPINIQGGYGATGQGGRVNILGGSSSDGQSAYGNVEIGSGTHAWIFDNSGNLTLPSNDFTVNYANGTQVNISGGGANTGNVTFDDVTVQGDNNSLNLSAGADFTANLAYLQVRAGDVSTHIHLDTGNNEAYDQYFGNDNKFVKLGLGIAGNVSIGTYQDGGVGQLEWTFDSNGNLVLPRGGVVYETNIPFGGLEGNTIALIPSGGTNADQQLLVYPTAGADFNHLHLTSGNLYNTELFLGNDNLYVKLANTGNIVINTNDDAGNTAQWTFGTAGTILNSGNLTLQTPSGGASGAYDINSQGGYNTGSYTNLSTTGGTGTGLTVNAGSDGGYINTITINTPGSGYTEGDTITLVGGDGIGCTFNITVSVNEWLFDTIGSLTLPAISLGTGLDEQTIIQSQRKIIPPFRYSVEIDGSTPTLVYSATDNSITSMKVTIQIQHTGLGFEFFEVYATSSGSDTYYSVSNRLHPPGITDSTVVVDLDDSNAMEITVTINSGAANSWVTYDATEFGIAVD